MKKKFLSLALGLVLLLNATGCYNSSGQILDNNSRPVSNPQPYPVVITGANVTYFSGNITFTGNITEVDPAFTASPAFGISAGDIADWTTAFGWGDHSLAGYLTFYIETDPIFIASAAFNIQAANITAWNNKQDALVSGVNIKTINSSSVLGAGDLVVTGAISENGTFKTLYVSENSTLTGDMITGNITSTGNITAPNLLKDQAGGIAGLDATNNITASIADGNQIKGGSAGQFLRALVGWYTITSADVISWLGYTPADNATLGQANGIATLNGSSLVVQNPANAVSVPAANKIPISDASATVDNWTSKLVYVKALLETTTLTVGNGQAYFTVPTEMNGMNLVAVAASVYTASTVGTPTFAIYNLTDSQNMLSTNITLDINELTSYTAAIPAVINASFDDVATGDQIRVDCGVAGTGTTGEDIILTFRKP